MHKTSLLQSPPSILSEMNSNLQILRDFVFQLNSDFISNSNPKTFGLLPHTYISLGAPPPRITMPISPQNRTLAATRVPPPLPTPIIAATSILKPSVQIKSSPKSCCCFSSGCDFSDELEVNPTLPVSSSCRTLAPGLYGSKIGDL
jgi:hypothetical protein